MATKHLIRDVLQRVVVATVLYLGCGVVVEGADKPGESITIGSLTTCMDRAALEGQFPGVFDVYHDPDGVSVLLSVFADGPDQQNLLQRLGAGDLFPDSRLWLGRLLFTRDHLVTWKLHVTTVRHSKEDFSLIQQFVARKWPGAPLEVHSDGMDDHHLTAVVGEARIKAENHNFEANLDIYGSECKTDP